MASIQTLPGFGSRGSCNKISKSRAKNAVKPILKKLSSQSEKSSLDLDRTWTDQDEQYQSRESWIGGGGGGAKGKGVTVVYEESTKELNYTLEEAGAKPYNHARSISGASRVSIATSSNSGPRHQTNGPFVHPFQQTPRTSTPPLSYANSQTSFFDITEDEDDEDDDNANSTGSGRSASNSIDASHSHRNSLHIQMNSHSHSQPTLGIRRPSLASTQRTSSFTEVKNAKSSVSYTSQHPPSLRINTSRTVLASQALPSHLPRVPSQSDFRLDLIKDSPISSSNPTSNHVASPASSTPMSPLRSSFDASGFPRLRAKSDLDTATRAEHLREARRKFELREKAKEEKYAREEIKRRERADNKRALEKEKHAAAMHKEQMAVKARLEAAELEEAIARGKHHRKFSATSSNRPSLAISRTSMSRPSTSRKNVPSPLGEPEVFASSNYDNMDTRSPPTFGNEAGGAQSVPFQPTRRRNTAKRRTQSTWTMFILWLRTKLLRVSRHR
ncbi:uncharacterized protein F4812DRAFT_452984 [Daldinia caldariorum]|uniref:uncharacterized protein n=1 Tax=Daldinia caldariorum TaxID=326644 RepID=UPI0020079812|nr:uncharacterized protein F4812DRAFT_452984 [Daldinia caldariorum]KAI1464385.1 hypothetical protein F4812DRAFT_452984 [Daldinia caldariorum]